MDLGLVNWAWTWSKAQLDKVSSLTFQPPILSHFRVFDRGLHFHSLTFQTLRFLLSLLLPVASYSSSLFILFLDFFSNREEKKRELELKACGRRTWARDGDEADG